MAKHNFGNRHAQHYNTADARHLRDSTGRHSVDQPSLAEQARMLLLLEIKPAKFREAVQPWLSRNPNDVMELGGDAPTVMRGVDFTPYSAKDLERLSFRNFSFVGAFLTDEAQAEQLFAAGASVIDAHHGEKSYSITRKQPTPAVTQPLTEEELVFAGRGKPTASAPGATVQLPLSGRALVDAQSAAMTAMLRGGK